MSDTIINGSPVSAPASTAQGRIPRPARTRRRQLCTFADAVDRVLRIEEINPSETRSVERAKLAVQAALSTFASYSTQGFRYYNGRFPIDVDASVLMTDGGTVASNVYTPTTPISWPSWVDQGYLRINQSSYEITAHTSGSLTLDGTLDDGSYTNVYLERMFYQLPQDFRCRGSISDNSEYYPLIDMHPGVLQSWQDYYDWARSVANPRVFGAVTADERFHGDLSLMIWPPYQTDQRLMMYYERYPHSLVHHRVGAGTMASVGTTITSDTAAFVEDHVGSVLVVGSDNDADIRNSLSDLSLVANQRMITGYTSSTVVTVDEALPSDISVDGSGFGVTYYVTDPVDVQPGVMCEAFFRLCEFELSRQARGKNTDRRYRDFIDALQLAMADDAKYKGIIDDSDRLAGFGYGIGDVTGRPE